MKMATVSMLGGIALLASVRALQYGDDNGDSMIAPENGNSDIEQEDVGDVHTYGPERLRSAMEYFQHWSRGKVESLLSTPRVGHGQKVRPEEQNSILQGEVEPPKHKQQLKQVQKQKVSAGAWASVLLLRAQKEQGCNDQPARDLREWAVHAHDQSGKDKVKHTVFLSSSGQFQYVVEHSGQLLVADPPACQKGFSSKPEEGVLLEEHEEGSPGSSNVAGSGSGDEKREPCWCMKHWGYLGQNYTGCAEIEFDDFPWCYVEDGENCPEAQPSIITGETRMHRECKTDVTPVETRNKTERIPRTTPLFNTSGPAVDTMMSPGGGGAEHLDPDSDPMVEDCIKLLERTVQTRCNDTEYKFKVLSATMGAVDGITVTMAVAVTGKLARVTFQKIQCAFELQTNHTVLDDINVSSTASSAMPAPADVAADVADIADSLPPAANASLVERDFGNKGHKKTKGQRLEIAQGLFMDLEEDTSKPKTAKKSKTTSKSVMFLDGKAEDDLSDDQKTESEKKGLHATLVMTIDVCNMEEESSIVTRNATKKNVTNTSTPSEDFDAATKSLMQHRTGEVSFYKGFEHYNDKVPRAKKLPKHFTKSKAPDAYDLRQVYGGCFPLGGTEVVRDQGNCGSCWAFATATAVMTNLCISGYGGGQDVLNSASDRIEVSVQELISCNDMQAGCEGGSTADADAAMARVGITKERDSKYQCGGGNPMDHFAAQAMTCDAPPWGGHCKEGANANPKFSYGGAVMIAGEDAMKTIIANGYALYVAINVNSDFMSLKKGTVFKGKGPGATEVGGHAVAIVAYLLSGAGDKIWVLQNSWNLAWADNGYGSILRGIDLMGVETTSATYFRTWITGTDPAKVPPCIDGSGSGMQAMDGSVISCEVAADPNSPYASLNLCSMDAVKNNCAVSCNSCVGRAGDPGSMGDGPVPNDPMPKQKREICLEGFMSNADDLHSQMMATDNGPCSFNNKCSTPINCVCESSGPENVYGIPPGGPYALGMTDFCDVNADGIGKCDCNQV